MKTLLPVLCLFVFAISASAQRRDLPTPTASLTTVTNGSYVIAMDNTLQTNTAGDFNLKSYGLIVHLLNNNVKVKWAIKTGKSKDGIDFTGTAVQMLPSLTASASRDFKAGPFVIQAADTTGVAALITGFYTARSLTGNNRPRVYRLGADVTNVDIRYNMTGFVPKAEILNDGKNSDIHVGYMTDCGITTANYGTGLGTDLISKCYTFASEPHNDKENVTTINAIKTFVLAGGNFLAQCAAIETYENSTVGRFQTTTGVDVVNTNVNAASTIYANPDLAFSQYDGSFDVKQSGSCSNWTLKSGGAFANNTHTHATGGTILTQTPMGATVSKLTSSTALGGLVFYVGNHEFSSVTSLESINGIRMYMNAFLTPVLVNNSCNIGSITNPLPVELLFFNATPDESSKKVQVSWATSQEINASHFVVERSTDGSNYNEVATVFAFGNTNERKDYLVKDNISTASASIIYYRLRQVDIDLKYKYSPVRAVKLNKQADNIFKITTYPNPATSEISVSIPAKWESKKVVYEMFNASGITIKRMEDSNASQNRIINVSNLTPGLYFLRASSEGEILQQKIIKQ